MCWYTSVTGEDINGKFHRHVVDIKVMCWYMLHSDLSKLSTPRPRGFMFQQHWVNSGMINTWTIGRVSERQREEEKRGRENAFIGVHGSQRWGQGREPWVGGRRQIIRHVKHMYILERIKWSQKTLAQGATNIGVSSLATLNKLISKPNTSLSAQNTMGMMTHCNEIRIHLHIKDRHLSG